MMHRFVSLTVSKDFHSLLENWLDKSKQIYPYIKIEDIENLYHIAMQEFIQHHKEELKNIVDDKNKMWDSDKYIIYDNLIDLANDQIKL